MLREFPGEGLKSLPFCLAIYIVKLTPLEWALLSVPKCHTGNLRGYC